MSGPTEQTYVIVGADVGHNTACRVTATNDQGSVSATTAAVVPVAKEPINTVLPTITGTTTQGQILTAHNGTWTGIPTITFQYQWRRGVDGIPIDDASGDTYELSTPDVGNKISVTVTGTNAHGQSEQDSALTADIAAASGSAGLTALIAHGFTWLDGRDLSNGATGNWVPNAATPGTGTAVLGSGTGSDTKDPSVTGGVLTFDGVDNYVALAANAITSFTPTTGEFTVIGVYKTAVTSGRIFSCESANQKGFSLGFVANDLYVVVGGATTNASSVRDRTGITVDGSRVNVFAGVVDDGTVACWADELGLATPVSIAGVGTITHGTTAATGIRSDNHSTSPITGQLYALLYTADAVTATELADISVYLRDEYT